MINCFGSGGFYPCVVGDVSGIPTLAARCFGTLSGRYVPVA